MPTRLNSTKVLGFRCQLNVTGFIERDKAVIVLITLITYKPNVWLARLEMCSHA